MRFVVGQVALRYLFLPVLPFSLVSFHCTALRTDRHLSTAQKVKLGTLKKGDGVSNIWESI